MDPSQFLTASRLHIVAGKGGVGKTAVTAVMASAASALGLSSLVIDVQGRSGMPRLFGCEHDELVASDGEVELRAATGELGVIAARSLAPDLALLDYLASTGGNRIADRLSRLGAIDIVTRSTPGMSDILLLGKVKKLAREHSADVILMDAPASGHAITFLRAPHALAASIDNGAIRDQADEVLALLGDPDRCQVTLVTIPEDTPVSETIETAFSVEDEVGIKLGPVIVNAVEPRMDLGGSVPVTLDFAAAGIADPKLIGQIESAASFRRDRNSIQLEHIERLGHGLPLQQILLDKQDGDGLGPQAVAALTEEYLDAIASLPDLSALDGVVRRP